MALIKRHEDHREKLRSSSRQETKKLALIAITRRSKNVKEKEKKMAGKLCLLFALFLLIGYSQAATYKQYNRNNDNNDDKNEEMLPYMFLMMQGNGATVTAAPGVCLLSLFGLGVVYLFSQYA